MSSSPKVPDFGDYLLQKPVEPTVLIDVVRRSIDTCHAMHRRRISDQSIRRRFEALTARETEILKLIVAGQANKKIAIAMKISIKTVANHRTSLMNKTGAYNAADLARLFTIANSGQRSPSDQPT
jgi:FixJ family two-component response regulator